jgi:hypothetical protein
MLAANICSKPTPPDDFNADTLSDILWRDPNTGHDQIWELNASGGCTVVNPGSRAAGWQVQT